MENNKLANFFNKWREVIEAAETPFSKLAIFILPILAPIVPAVLTGMHIFKLLLEIFTFKYSTQASWALSIVVALVLEILGYVGAVSFIQSLFKAIRTRNEAYYLPTALNFFSYVFYLISMYLINVQLGEYFGTPKIMNNIVGLLAFITVPTSLLAANHLGQKEISEDNDRLRREKTDERLKRVALKHGINVFAPAPVVTLNQDVPTVKEERERKASDYKVKIWQYLDEQYTKGKLLRVVDITEHFHLDYNKAKGFVSTQRTLWAQDRGVDLRTSGSTS